MSEAGTLMSLSTLAALAISHLWQSVAVAATLAVILILGRRVSGAARYALACAALAAAISLPLAVFAPGAGARAMLLDLLKAPLVLPAPVNTPAAMITPVAATPSSTFGLDVASAALDGARAEIASASSAQPGAGFGLSMAQTALDATRNQETVKPAERSWGRPIAVAPQAIAKRPAWFSSFTLPKLPDLGLPFLVVWLTGSLTLLVRVGRDFFAAERLVKRAHTVPLPVELAKRLGRVRLAISPDAPGPMTAGLFNPSVILPEAAIQRIGTVEMAALLEHELAHIERRDVVAALVQRIAIALLWWSPAIYWISRRIDEEREAACDETAVARTGDARAFARSLTSQAETQLWARAPKLAVGAIGRRSQFGRRIKRLVEMARAGGVPEHYSGRLAFTGLALAVALAAFLTPKLALADVPKPPPSVEEPKAAQKAPLPLAPDVGRDAPRLEGAIRTNQDADTRHSSDSQAAADLGADRSLQLADLGLAIGGIVSDQVSEDVPAILEQVRDQLHDQRIEIGDLNDLSDADRERLRAEMKRVRDELKAKFGPEFRERIQREVDHARREVDRARSEVERHRADWSDSDAQRRQALAIARDAVAKAHAEIEAARNRGDFSFNFDFSAFDRLASIDWAKTHGQIDVKLANSSPDRQLMEAANDGDLARVRELIKQDADPDRDFPGAGSALIAAARQNHIEVMRVLLDAGADADQDVRGVGNALIAAASRGYVDAARLLIERGADVDADVRGEATPLIAAASEGDLDMVKLLVEHDADVNLASRVMGRMRTPISVAQARGYDTVAAYLRVHGGTAD